MQDNFHRLTPWLRTIATARRSRLVGLALLTSAILPPAARAATPVLAPLAALQTHGVRVSAAFVDLSNRQTLAAINPDQRLIPASVTKLYTAAAALQQWGAAHTFTTRVMASGLLRQGVLHGDLTLVGGGDPALTHDDFATLARQLRQRGLRRVTGGLRMDNTRFGQVACVTADRCAALLASDNSYNAPLAAAGVDFSNASVLVSPAASVGQPAQVGFDPFDLPMLRLQADVKTVADGAATRLHTTRITRDGRDLIRVTGRIAHDSAAQYRYRSVSAPLRFSGEMLAASLRKAGIEVDGKIRVAGAPPGARVLASVEGQPLGEQLRGMLTYSNNYMADVLALDLLHAAGAHPPLSLPAAGDRLAAFARGIDRHSPFRYASRPARSTTPLTLHSGSGLTVDNRLSAADLVALLDHEYRRFGDFPAYLGALTVPDQTPVKLLGERGDHDWQTRIAVKTGSMNDPYPVYALAGYFRFQDGLWGAFAVLINGTRHGPDIDRNQSLAAIRRSLERLLASR